jgi:hypothetical protein
MAAKMSHYDMRQTNEEIYNCLHAGMWKELPR